MMWPRRETRFAWHSNSNRNVIEMGQIYWGDPKRQGEKNGECVLVDCSFRLFTLHICHQAYAK